MATIPLGKSAKQSVQQHLENEVKKRFAESLKRRVEILRREFENQANKKINIKKFQLQERNNKKIRELEDEARRVKVGLVNDSLKKLRQERKNGKS